jgi:chromosome segregation ATPase
MHAKRILACLATLAIAACAPDQIAPPPVARPVETVPIAPLVEKARQEAADARETASQLSDKVDVLHDQTAKLGTGLKAATAEADRLRQQKAASEKELDGLWQMLTNEQSRAAALFDEVEKSKTLADQHRQQLLIAAKRIDALLVEAARADAELTALRAQHDDQAAQINQAREIEARLQDQLKKAEADAALSRTIKSTAGIAMVALLVFGLIILAMKIR